MAAQRPAERTARCAFCGETFTIQPGPGPAPTYCSQAHRQRAYEQRRRTGRSDEERQLAEELRTLRARVGVLEFENKQLRQALDETTEEMLRLRSVVHPLPDSVRRLVDTPPAGTPRPTVAESATRPRRWWTRPEK
jgi:hypothetical protein